MLKRNPLIKHLSFKIQNKFLSNFNIFKKPKIFAGKETGLILHPELAVEINDNNDPKRMNRNKRKDYNNYDKENDRNIIIDNNLDFLKLDSNGKITNSF